MQNASVQQPLSMEPSALSFVIPSEPGFPTSPLSPATTHVVLSKENHTHLTKAATLDRKSGGAEGSAVQRTFRGNVFLRAAQKPLALIGRHFFVQHVRGRLYFLLSRADSMAAVTCGESGVTAGSKRSSGLPLRSNRNLVKFHLISPPICGLTDLSVRKA